MAIETEGICFQLLIYGRKKVFHFIVRLSGNDTPTGNYLCNEFINKLCRSKIFMAMKNR